MRHTAVRRAAVLLGAGFLAWAVLFAWIARREPPDERLGEPAAATSTASTALAPAPATGAALFDRHCGSCHTDEEMRSTAGAGTDDGARSRLEQFLNDHGEASADDDRRILDYLAGRRPE